MQLTESGCLSTVLVTVSDLSESSCRQAEHRVHRWNSRMSQHAECGNAKMRMKQIGSVSAVCCNPTRFVLMSQH